MTPLSDAPQQIVGIGASAGGLNALQTFLENVPDELQAPIVIVMHLSPTHDSRLADLLQASTLRRVSQVEQDTAIQAGQVYVIPPNRNLSAVDTHLRLSDLEPRIANRAPIDHFFRTLAQNDGQAAVAVVLTGTGTDGTVGAKLVKEAGGMIAIQDPVEARYESMPSSVLETGLVDVVAKLKDLPGAIARFLHIEPSVEGGLTSHDWSGEAGDALQHLLKKIHDRTDHDFRAYKRSSMLRRLRHRMQVLGVEGFADYDRLLDDDPAEIDRLCRDLLITVTHFFRDRAAFDFLADEVVPSLFEGKGGSDQVRAWSTGCATGEEAYSIAMLLLEHAADLEDPPDVQVFATDVHDDALRTARKGAYSDGIEHDVGRERLARFFVQDEGGGYRVKKLLRESVLFARHDVLSDPPFLHLDLITCRNLLIFLSREVHEELFAVFHHALRAEGRLMLGTSENVEGSTWFSALAENQQVFRRNEPATSKPPVTMTPMRPLRRTGPGIPDDPGPRSAAPVSLHRRMLQRYGPASALLNREFEIVHLSESAGRFMIAPGGEPTHNLLKVVRQELRVELHAALHRARQESGPVRSVPVPVHFDGERQDVSIWAQAATNSDVAGLMLVLFQEIDPGSNADAETADDAGDASVNHAAELEVARKRLQAVIAEYETSQEELRASNLELQSINEELQSTTEEFQSSKEELESMNEELLAVSQEYKSEIAMLHGQATDHEIMLRTIDVAALLLDRDMHIRRFTPKLHDLFNVLPTDLGRPLAHLTHKLASANVVEVATEVLEREATLETTVSSESGRVYRMVVAPSRITDDSTDGVVIHFVDISDSPSTGRRPTSP